MSAIAVISRNTLRQAVRERLFFNVVIFGVGMVLLSMVVGQITVGFPDRVVRSIGLSGVTIAVDLIALLLGATLIHQEIDRKTLFVVLTRPVRRWKYLVGRYLGLMMSVALALVGFSGVFCVTLVVSGGSIGASDLYALLAVLPEAAIIGAFGTLLSCISTPMLSTGLGLGFWIAGASTDDLVRLTEDAGPATVGLMKVLYYALPSLARLDFRTAAVYEQAVSISEFMAAISYGVIYAAFLVAIACAVLTRREMV